MKFAEQLISHSFINESFCSGCHMKSHWKSPKAVLNLDSGSNIAEAATAKRYSLSYSLSLSGYSGYYPGLLSPVHSVNMLATLMSGFSSHHPDCAHRLAIIVWRSPLDAPRSPMRLAHCHRSERCLSWLFIFSRGRQPGAGSLSQAVCQRSPEREVI